MTSLEERLELASGQLLERVKRVKSRPIFLDANFHEQSAFIADPSKLKVNLCTRRAGKSWGDGLYLFKEAYENPGVTCLYIALTRDSARRIMWKDVLKPINKVLQLGAKPNETDLTLTLPNGAMIYLLGADTSEAEKEKLLGQKYKLVIVDEAASFSIDLHALVYGTLKPAVADYRGTICLTGTPRNLKTGFYFELTKGQDPGTAGTWQTQGWSGHRWSALDNPYMRENWLAEIAELKVSNPRIEETPLFQQNYLGRWTIDDTNLVYKYLAGRNDFSALPVLPRGRWHQVLGVDLGYEDDTSFSVCAYHDHDTDFYVLESAKEKKLDVTATAEKIKGYQARYDFDRIVIDNANKQAVEEMKKRHGLPLFPADKRGKSDFIEIMNGEFIQGRIKLGPLCEPLKDEYANLIWDERSEKREEHPNCANHCADATLYPWRYCYGYLSEVLKAAGPKPGSLEWRQRHEELMRKQAEEAETRAEQEWAERKREQQEWEGWQ